MTSTATKTTSAITIYAALSLLFPPYGDSPPASTEQPLVPYDPEILFNTDPEFSHYHLHAKMEGDILSADDPETGQPMEVGRRVILTPETVEGEEVFLGKYTELEESRNQEILKERTAILITETVRAGEETLLR